jgi:hypothetical protein
VLVGEYANVQYNLRNTITGVNWAQAKLELPIWVGAVSEAIFAIGCERNGDVVMGMAYAPGFMNRDSYEWSVCSPFCFPSRVFSLLRDETHASLTCSEWSRVMLLRNCLN